MADLSAVLAKYEDGDQWRVVDVRTEQWPDGSTRLLTLAHLGDGGKDGFSIEEGVTVDADHPYVMTWNLHGDTDRYSSRDEAVADLVAFVERYEATHDIWTCDMISLFHIRSESDVELVFHAGLTGTLYPDEEKWGGFDEATRKRADEQYAAFVKASTA